MKNRITRFLLTSLIGVALLCVCVFTFFAIHMGNQSAATINQVGTLYMSSMSQQTSVHFESIIGIQMNQLRALVGTIPSDAIHEDKTLQQQLMAQAKARDFTYLGFYGSDGSMEMLYGSQLTVTDPEPFLASLRGDQQKVAIGTNAQGEKVVLLAPPWWPDCPYPTSAITSPWRRTASGHIPLSSGGTVLLSSAATTPTATTTLSGCGCSMMM